MKRSDGERRRRQGDIEEKEEKKYVRMAAAFAPLLDGAALSGIAMQLLSARQRLSLRTGGALPTVGELAVGLRMYINHCDAEREESVQDGVGGDTEELEQLKRMLKLAYITYQSRTQLLAHAERERFQVVSARHEAQRWLPAYYLAYFRHTNTILLCVRGSQETTDLLTNLSVETEPFLDGLAHRGIVQSARRLHAALKPIIEEHVRSHHANCFQLTGHSLGAAVASALTLLFRTAQDSHDGIVGEGGASHNEEKKRVADVLQQATCIAFAPPPFLSRRLAARTGSGSGGGVGGGVKTIVVGLDAVPRLSAASLDRFLLRVARHDWTPQIGSTLHRAASSVVGEENAERVSTFLAQRGGTGAFWAVSALRTAAQRALETSRAGAARSPLWEGALSLGVMTSSLVANQFLGRTQFAPGGAVAERQPEYNFARHFGMSAEDVERTLRDGPPEMYLAGDITYFDIPFLSAEAFAEGRPTHLATVRNVGRDEFGEVEGSVWMINHHKPSVLMDQLQRMLGEVPEVPEVPALPP